MSCNDVREFLPAYLDQQLAAHQANLVKSHLHICRACSYEYEMLQATLQFCAELPELTPPPDFHANLMARLQAEVLVAPVAAAVPAARQVSTLRRRLLPNWLAAPAAAAAALVIGLGVYAQMPRVAVEPPNTSELAVVSPQPAAPAPEAQAPIQTLPEPQPAKPVPAQPEQPAPVKPVQPQPKPQPPVVSEPAPAEVVALQPEAPRKYSGVAAQLQRVSVTVATPEQLKLVNDLQSLAETLGGTAYQVDDGVISVRIPSNRLPEAISRLQAMADIQGAPKLSADAVDNYIKLWQKKAEIYAAGAADRAKALQEDPTNEKAKEDLAKYNLQVMQHNDYLVLLEELTAEAEISVIVADTK